jgi:transcriptional regulator with XRE-family HTH domain
LGCLDIEKLVLFKNFINFIIKIVCKVKKMISDIPEYSQTRFLQALEAEMKRQNLSLDDLAKKLKVPYSYIVSIKNGHRAIDAASRDKIERFAAFLNVPVVQIYIWGEVLKPEDFVFSYNIEDTLDSAYEKMINDPIMANILPKKADWENKRIFSQDAKIMCARIYELLSQELLLEHALVDVDVKNYEIVKHVVKRAPRKSVVVKKGQRKIKK